ncbi:MAG TPA: universal stress protein [Noviherbaspirillum sp.]|nr:universal stress protein [Noviherbaspirillum sp.]
MGHIRKILVATDYSDDARPAETRAAMLSVQLKADVLELMTVQSTRMGLATPATLSSNVEVRSDAALPLLDSPASVQAAAREGSGPACVRSLRTGNAATAITERADEMGAGLVVVASRRRKFLADIFARHNSNELIRLSSRPVLLVNREPNDAYRNVLVAVDFSDESREAARMALAIAPSAHFTFLHVFRLAGEEMMLETGVSLDVIHGYRQRARETSRAKLNSFIDSLGPRRQLVSRSVQFGPPSAVISVQARELKADLIAVGKHGKSRFATLLLGSVTQRLIEQGQCDLLVTNSPYIDDWDQPPAA